MNLYLVRHGETDWNAQSVLMGQADIPLNNNGVNQAKALRQEIKRRDLHFNAVYVSPLQRTHRTAEIITDGSYDLLFDERLKERAIGEFEGRPASELFDNEIDFLDPDLNASDFGVEPITDFQQRAADFLASLREKHSPNENILIVTSNGLMKRLASVIDQIPAEEVPNFQNGQVYTYTIY